MKDITQKELRDGRPDLHLLHTVGHCLKRLFADRRHSIFDEVVKGLTFEELIGCLLQAEDVAMDTVRDEEERKRIDRENA